MATHAALLAILLPLAPNPQLVAPVPSAADLARAEAEVQEVFGRDLAKARKAADKAALARKMIETAAGSRPAAKYALLAQIRELAIAAGDSAMGVKAVAELVDGFAPQRHQDAASRGPPMATA